jgi:N-methylhydantoinase B
MLSPPSGAGGSVTVVPPPYHGCGILHPRERAEGAALTGRTAWPERPAMVKPPSAMRSDSPAIDPVTLAVLDNRLRAIVEEMGEAMLRSSYSQILNSSRDFSIALCDAGCRLVAQADHIPVHVGAMPWAARAVAEAFPDAREGDTFLLNDPYHGGSHLPDLTILVPVFAEGALRFWSVVRAHQSDIGGATHGGYNPGATEIWQEGPPRAADPPGRRRRVARGPPADAGGQHPHSRGFPWRSDGDGRRGPARARTAPAVAGEARSGALEAAVGAVLDLSEAHARRIVSGWPDGAWKGEAFLDDDGFGREDIAIRATVTKRGDALTVDLSGATSRRRASSTPPSPTCAAPCAWPSPTCSTRRWRRTTAPSARWRCWRARARWSGRGRARR